MHKLIALLCFVCLSSFAQDAASLEELKAKLTPADLNLDGMDADIEAYLKKVPENRKEIEGRRLGIIKNFKRMVQKVISRNPYEGKIFLKSKTISGTIKEAKDDVLVIIDSNKEKSSVKWDELNPRQYSDIFIAEAVSRVKNLKADKSDKNADVSFKKAGNFYFALAVFYDWYGNEAASKIFRKKAEVLNPDKKEEIKQLWPPDKSLKN